MCLNKKIDKIKEIVAKSSFKENIKKQWQITISIVSEVKKIIYKTPINFYLRKRKKNIIQIKADWIILIKWVIFH